MAESFGSEVRRVLDRLLSDERAERHRVEGRRQVWKEAVHDFRAVASQSIVPILQEVLQPLRDRGFRPFINNNSRLGMTVNLDVDRDDSPGRSLCFRLDADQRAVECLVLGPSASRLETPVPLDTVDRGWVEKNVLYFLEQLS
ncbi:MAG: hypothetical protein ACRD0X_08290 [Thermoanaerobaculia bacterium]